MKLSSLNWRLAGAVIMLMASFSVNADTRLDQVWTCTLNDGKTLEEFSAIHGKWLAWANKQDYGGDIRGHVALHWWVKNLAWYCLSIPTPTWLPMPPILKLTMRLRARRWTPSMTLWPAVHRACFIQ